MQVTISDTENKFKIYGTYCRNIYARIVLSCNRPVSHLSIILFRKGGEQTTNMSSKTIIYFVTLLSFATLVRVNIGLLEYHMIDHELPISTTQRIQESTFRLLQGSMYCVWQDAGWCH